MVSIQYFHLCFNIHILNIIDISKKHFGPGGLAASKWTRSVRAVRDTPVAVYSAPSVNPTRRVAYRPPIAVFSRSVGLLF
jgi:hypothetical protein